MNQGNLFEEAPSTVDPAYRRRLEKAIRALPVDRKAKAYCRAVLADDNLDDLRRAFIQHGARFPLDEPELGEWATGKWTLHERLEALASFAPIFRNPTFEAGKWKGSMNPGDQMPWFDFNEKVSSFKQSLYDYGWVLGTNWSSWMKTADAQRLSTYPAALEIATPAQLAKVLTVSARRDRFMEGSFAADIDSGLIGRVIQRAVALLQQLDASSVRRRDLGHAGEPTSASPRADRREQRVRRSTMEHKGEVERDDGGRVPPKTTILSDSAYGTNFIGDVPPLPEDMVASTQQMIDAMPNGSAKSSAQTALDLRRPISEIDKLMLGS